MPLLRRRVRLGAAVFARLQHRPYGWSSETKQRHSTDGRKGDGRAPVRTCEWRRESRLRRRAPPGGVNRAPLPRPPLHHRSPR
eukprot:12746809-Heterocapsa_arctica.AAC.1